MSGNGFNSLFCKIDKIIKETFEIPEKFDLKNISFWKLSQYDFEGFTEEILNKLVFISYKNLRIFYKNIVDRYENNKNTLLPDYYMRYYLRKNLYYKWI